MEGVLAQLLEPDSERIKAATVQLRAAFKQPGVIAELCNILRSVDLSCTTSSSCNLSL